YGPIAEGVGRREKEWRSLRMTKTRGGQRQSAAGGGPHVAGCSMSSCPLLLLSHFLVFIRHCDNDARRRMAGGAIRGTQGTPAWRGLSNARLIARGGGRCPAIVAEAQP